MDLPGEKIVREMHEIVRLREEVQALRRELRKSNHEQDLTRDVATNYQSLAEGVLDFAFIVFDAQTRIVSWSRGAEHMLGYSQGEALGQPGSIIFTPEDRASGALEKELATARSERCTEEERWHLRQDGTRFWGSGVLTAHRDENANLQAYSKIMRNLTARKLLAEQLQESEERFRLSPRTCRITPWFQWIRRATWRGGTRERREHLATRKNRF